MSLLNSLFGTKQEEADEANEASQFNKGLFDTVVDIPTKPTIVAPPTTAAVDDGGDVVMYGPPERPATEPTTDPPHNNDDTETEARTIFVGNLPTAFVGKKRKLTELFADCGTITSARFRSVATTGVKVPADQKGNQDLVRKVSVNTQKLDTSFKQSVSAYIVFADPASVELALEKNHMEVSADPDSKNAVRHLRVDRVEPTYHPAQTVFVGNLPYAADEESLTSYFSGLLQLPVQSVRIVRDKETFQCKGFGYVLLADRASVAKALQYPHATSNYMGRRLRVQVCGKRYKSQSANRSDRQPPPKVDRAQVAVGALRRVLAKKPESGGGGGVRKKKRGKKGSAAAAGGMSKRAASEAKVNQRIKKIEKRIAKGMGKTRKQA